MPRPETAAPGSARKTAITNSASRKSSAGLLNAAGRAGALPPDNNKSARTKASWSIGVRPLASKPSDPHARHVVDAWGTSPAERANCDQCRAADETAMRPSGSTSQRVAGGLSVRENATTQETDARRAKKGGKARGATKRGREKGGQDTQHDGGSRGEGLNGTLSEDADGGQVSIEAHSWESTGPDEINPAVRARQGWETRRHKERSANALVQILRPELEEQAHDQGSSSNLNDTDERLRGLELHAYRFYQSHNALDVPIPRDRSLYPSKRRRQLESIGAITPSPSPAPSVRGVKQSSPERFADGKSVGPEGAGYRRRDMYEAMDPAALAALGSLTEQLVASALRDTDVAAIAQQIYLASQGLDIGKDQAEDVTHPEKGERESDGSEGDSDSDGEDNREDDGLAPIEELSATARSVAYAAEALRLGRVPREMEWLSNKERASMQRLVRIMDEVKEQDSIEREIRDRRARIEQLVEARGLAEAGDVATRSELEEDGGQDDNSGDS